MGFWVFMLIMDLLTPAIMIGFGRGFMKHPPKTINMVYGYRTSMSMKNKETWDFAHKYFGKLWYICGLAILLPTVIVMIAVLGKDTDTVGTAGGILCVLQLVPLIGCIFPTECALRRHFDKQGNPRPGEEK